MIRTPLMEHQKKIVEFCKTKKYFGIFADYGTGKTLCALSYINYHKLSKVLIVSTKTAIQSTWVDEIKLHTDFMYVSLVGTKINKIKNLHMGLRKAQLSSGYYHAAQKNTVLFLLNFDGVENIFNELIQVNFDFVVVDESTKIKSPHTKRTKVLWKLAEYIDKRCIMTGFPITENLADLYSQIKFLDMGKMLGTSYYGFIHKYFTKIAFKPLPRKKSVMEVVKNIKTFCIRITNTALKLPPKIYKTEHVELTDIQKRLLDQLKDYFQIEYRKVSFETEYIFALINKSLQICAGFIKDDKGNVEVVKTNKDEMLADLLEEIDVYNKKVIIWCTYLHTTKKLALLLKSFNPLILTGATANVNTLVNEFQHSKRRNILIAIQKKGAASITLTNCNYAIYYSNSWSFDDRYNSEARIYRKGSEKHKHVTYIDLVARDTIEERVLKCLKTKKDLVNELKEYFLE